MPCFPRDSIILNHDVRAPEQKVPETKPAPPMPLSVYLDWLLGVDTDRPPPGSVWSPLEQVA